MHKSKFKHSVNNLFRLLSLTLLLPLAISSCSHLHKDSKELKVLAKSNSDVTGTINVSENKDGVKIHLDLSGLKPKHQHGFHVHEKGDCSSPDAKSAGGHFSPDSSHHGAPTDRKHHLGDLGNVWSDSQGRIKTTIQDDHLTLSTKSTNSIMNRALVLHAEKDDFKSQPSGNSGKRIACAVIN